MGRMSQGGYPIPGVRPQGPGSGECLHLVGTSPAVTVASGSNYPERPRSGLRGSRPPKSGHTGYDTEPLRTEVSGPNRKTNRRRDDQGFPVSQNDQVDLLRREIKAVHGRSTKTGVYVPHHGWTHNKLKIPVSQTAQKERSSTLTSTKSP